MLTYINWDASGVEVIQPGEEELKHKVAKHFTDLQGLQFQKTHHCMRATHLKTQGCVKGKMTIHANLPEHLAQSMFAIPGVRDVIMRYSSLPFTVGADTNPALRGLGLKVFDVPGGKLCGDATTQDFTFNNYPTLELRDMPGSNKLGGKEVALAPARIPTQAHMVAIPQYSQGAYRYGKYVAKYALFPSSDDQKALEQIMIQEADPVDILSQNLRRYHAEKKATFSFCVQLLENLQEQPVEDLGIEWNADKYPFQQVATLEFEPQNSFDNAFRT